MKAVVISEIECGLQEAINNALALLPKDATFLAMTQSQTTGANG
jgi:hypothetical protein